MTLKKADVITYQKGLNQDREEICVCTLKYFDKLFPKTINFNVNKNIWVGIGKAMNWQTEKEGKQ